MSAPADERAVSRGHDVAGALACHMPRETFRANWRGWTRSSEGYAVRILGRTNLQYTDDLGELSIFVEPMSNWTDIVVDMSTIPDQPERPREEVVARLRRAFEYRGWSLIEGEG
jgi:hypothetical protein